MLLVFYHRSGRDGKHDGLGLLRIERPYTVTLLLIPCDTSMPRDSVDMYLFGWGSLASGRSVGPGVCDFLEVQDGILARASGAALQLLCHFLVI